MSTEMAATDSATSLGAESTVVDETVTSSSLPGKSGSNAYSVLGDIVTFYNYYTSLIPWLATFCNGLSFLVLCLQAEALEGRTERQPGTDGSGYSGHLVPDHGHGF